MPFINDPQGRQEVEKVSRRLKLPVWKSICKGEFRKWWNEWWDKIDTFAEAIEAIKIEAGTGLKGGGNLTENRILSLKEATKTDLGGIIIGENLTYNPTTGAVDGNPTYTHPNTEGNKHIPAGGVAGNIILWGSSGTGTWGKLKYTDIVGTPTSLKNPYSLTLQFNGINQEGYNGEAAKTINITPVGIGAAEKTHKHSKDDITDLSLSKPLTIKFNGTSQGDYIGEVAKEINITPAGIGAEPVFNKNSAFNKNFGTVANTVLDGAKLAESLGIPYGGTLNNTNAKAAGTAYYDSTTKKTYKCTVANSLNYADSTKYEAISNNDLLAKLQNLTNISIETIWEGASTWDKTLSLNKDLRNYKLIIFVFSGTYNNTIFYNPLIYPIKKTENSFSIILTDTWGGTAHTVNTANGTIAYAGFYSGSNHGDNTFRRIIGIKF